ncbi:hypothetical protein [Methanosarcina sp.]|uniref:hypothetical protein n=1 Tax=Methanosarcina sp. TaxID=2213 RepID=UPI0029882E3C|nr:hypothetical protein [Methanosarcina sp.]MDW5549489.1 hypothetical protein [Methanosarcina sp.]MDW5553523.1 hypothetical protein [Methanosarcina sp.]MDW5558673.1 hypothetical protein [Methanosarcina sp.]
MPKKHPCLTRIQGRLLLSPFADSGTGSSEKRNETHHILMNVMLFLKVSWYISPRRKDVHAPPSFLEP